MLDIKKRLGWTTMEVLFSNKDIYTREEVMTRIEGVANLVNKSVLTVPYYIHEWFDGGGGTDTFLSTHLNKVVALSYESEEDLAEEQRKVFEWLFQEGEGTNEEANAQIQVAKMYCNGYIVEEEK